MCFSAEASFTAAAVLSGLSFVSFKAAKRKSLWFLACFPLFFAIQQLSEGITWLNLKGVILSSFITHTATWIYLLFALAIWPIWMTLTVYFNEQDFFKQKIFLIFFMAAVVLAYNNLRFVPLHEVQPTIKGNHIDYFGHTPLYWKALYALIVAIPTLLSSLRYMWVIGILLIISFAIAEFFYSFAFISVWCFFAIIISIGSYLVIKRN